VNIIAPAPVVGFEMQKHAPSRKPVPYRFVSMASPCEVCLDGAEETLTNECGAIAEEEAKRIEQKYSRYRPDSVISRINGSNGRPVPVDLETAALLDYAENCFHLSKGLFDITSGVLRRIWRFDGSGQVPSNTEIERLLPLVGWEKVLWNGAEITLPPGMEIDFGGLGKEYAVDRAFQRITEHTGRPFLVNFGGDLRVSAALASGRPWRIAIDSVDGGDATEGVLHIKTGALTTSGDARRYLLIDGVRYGHILNPRTGKPITGAPRSVTVSAPTCMQAGILSTLAMLQGANASEFLRCEGVAAWVLE
jgi:FAD:protein FMN transferase